MNTVTVTVRFSAEQNDQIERAAAAARKTVSDYLRDIVGPWVASDLGEPEPVKVEPPKVRPLSLITQAARLEGVSREAFRQHAAEMVAEQIVQRLKSEPPPAMTPPAPTRKSTPPSGQYRAVRQSDRPQPRAAGGNR